MTGLLVFCAQAPHASAIVSGQNSALVLGQNDGLTDAPSPIYTKAAAQNVAHKLGLSAPMNGVALDTAGHRLFVSDTSNNRILVFNLDGSNNLIDRVPDNVLGQLNFYSNAAGATQIGLETPNGMTLDGSSRLFVAEGAGSRVKIFDIASITDGEPAINVLGQAIFTGTAAGTTQVGMSVPQDVAFDAANDRLFVSDSTLNRVTVYDLAPGLKSNMRATNLIGQNNSLLSGPSPIFTKTTAHNAPNRLGLSAPMNGLVVDSAGHRLFVSDTSNNRILIYNLDSNDDLIDRVPDNVLGQLNFYSNAAGATQIGLETPNGMTVDDNNRLFVAEGAGSRVKVFDVTAITDGEAAMNVLGQATFAGTTAGTTQVGMSVPQDVAFDAANDRLFVSDSTLNRVTVYDVATIVNGESAINVLGQTLFTTSTAATTQAGMNVPYGLAYDSGNSRLFVAQGTGNRVTTYDVSSITDGENAVNVLGQTNFTNTAAATTQAGMDAPRGITYDDGTNILYVAQTTADRVTTYNVASITDGENAVNVLGQANFTGTVAAATQAGMSAATGVAIDEDNDRLYVLQSGANRVSIFDVSSVTDGEDAVDALGQYDDDLADPGPIFTKGTAHDAPNALGLSAPIIGLALDPTDHRLFVSDTSNNRVLVYELDNSNVLDDMIPDFVLGQANFYTNTAASTQTGFETPNGLAYDDAGNRLFVTEGAGSRVKVFDVAAITNGENAINVLGQLNFTGTTAATTQAGMSQPVDATYDATGSRLFVSDATLNRVTVYDVAAITDGENAVSVLGQANFTSGTAATTQAGMNVPYGLTLSGSTATTLFVAQSTGNRVTSYEVTAITDGENAIKVLGQATFTGTTAATTQAGLSAPRGITYDETNKRLYVGDMTNNRVLAFDVAAITDGENAIAVLGQALFTTATAAITTEGFSAPTGVLVDTVNNLLYVLQSTANRLSIFDLTLGVGNGNAAISVLGQALYTTNTAATTQAGMNVPYGLAYDSANTRLFVAQGVGNRVTTYNVAAITDGENAINVLGQTNFTNTAAAVTQAGMDAPRGITFDDSSDILYVAQTTADRVTTYDVAAITDGENAISVLGQADFTGTAVAVTQAGMSAATGVAIDEANDRLYVLQSGANRVSIFDVAAITNGENAIDALGQYDDNLAVPEPIFTKGTANNAPHKMGFSGPQAVTIDAGNDRLFVADTSNNRILVYNLNSSLIPLDTIPDNVLGQANFYTNTLGTTQTGLNAPTSMDYDAVGNRLFVADMTNNRVVVYDAASISDGEAATDVLGQVNFTTLTAATTQLGLSGPRDVDYDEATGTLYVADTNNNRIVVFTVGSSGSLPSGGGGDSFNFFGF